MSRKGSEKNEKRGLVEFLTVKTGLPCDILTGDFRIELRGRNQLYLHGCRRIIKYSTEEMKLAAAAFSVCVTGKRLICSAYYGGTVCIEGHIVGFMIEDAED